MSLSSGSSGNCYYLASDEGGLLIDAGIPARSIAKELKYIGVSLDSGWIKGLVITHEHADHTRTAGVIGGIYNIPVYASVPVHNSIATSRFINESIGASRRNLELGEHFSLAGFELQSFLVPHDSLQNYGYHIRRGDFSFTLATDIGHLTSDIRRFASQAKYLVVEANYDPEMLRSGSYPAFLKDRVSGPFGHLSNGETASFLGEIYNPLLKHVWLCHLSKENNHPDLCWKSISSHLYNMGLRVGKTEDNHQPHYEGKDLILDVLPRTKATQVFLLEE